MLTINTVARQDIDRETIDEIRILPFTKTITVVMRNGYEKEGKFVSVQEGRQIHFVDRDATEHEEAQTGYTDFLAGRIDIGKIEAYISGK